MSPAGLMTGLGIAPADAAARKPDDAAKARDAAQQFEALLIGQILRSAREGESGWLGSGGDSASSCATDMAEQQLATVLAQRGGLGLAEVIAKGLQKT
jgi:peptidoglycan hydrolase FlgJ